MEPPTNYSIHGKKKLTKIFKITEKGTDALQVFDKCIELMTLPEPVIQK